MKFEDVIYYVDFSNLLEFWLGFFIGVVFGPISMGLVYFIISIIVYEAVVFWATKKLKKCYRLDARIIINIGSLIGWLVSRKLFNGQIL